MATLDRTRSYAQVLGDRVKYAYMQDHKLFNQNGQEVDEKGNLITVKAAPLEAPKTTKANTK